MQIVAETLAEKEYLTVDVLFKRHSRPSLPANILVFRYNDQVYAYVNHCMHMHRPLNCLEEDVFDAERNMLRCSMHGFIFQPETGICVSPVCEGQALQAVKVIEQDGLLVCLDKHIQVLAVHKPQSKARQESS